MNPQKSLLEKEIKAKGLTIGCDPEFIFTDPLNVMAIPAWQVLSNRKNRGPILDRDFGTDTHSETAEVRVLPSTNPLDLVREIGKVLATGVKGQSSGKRAFYLNWYADNRFEAVGGHIHFGHKLLEDCETDEGPILAITGALDDLLSIVVMMVEAPERARWRKQGSYGGRRDIRVQDYGFEYRTPPSFLASPQLASGTLCLAYAIAFDVLFHGFASHALDGIDPEELSGGFQGHYSSLLSLLLDRLEKEIKGLTLYPIWATEIDWLLDKAKVRETQTITEMKEGWGISGPDPLSLLPSLKELTGAFKEVKKQRPSFPLPDDTGFLGRSGDGDSFFYGSSDHRAKITEPLSLMIVPVITEIATSRFYGATGNGEGKQRIFRARDYSKSVGNCELMVSREKGSVGVIIPESAVEAFPGLKDLDLKQYGGFVKKLWEEGGKISVRIAPDYPHYRLIVPKNSSPLLVLLTLLPIMPLTSDFREVLDTHFSKEVSSRLLKEGKDLRELEKGTKGKDKGKTSGGEAVFGVDLSATSPRSGGGGDVELLTELLGSFSLTLLPNGLEGSRRRTPNLNLRSYLEIIADGNTDFEGTMLEHFTPTRSSILEAKVALEVLWNRVTDPLLRSDIETLVDCLDTQLGGVTYPNFSSDLVGGIGEEHN